MGVDPGQDHPLVLLRTQLLAQKGLAPEDGRAPRVTGGVGAAEHQPPHPPRVADGQLLRLRATHREADHVGLLDAKGVQQADGVLGQVRHGVGAVRRLRLADVPVVVGDAAEALAEGGRLVGPAAVVVAQPHNPEDGLALAALAVEELEAGGDANLGHWRLRCQHRSDESCHELPYSSSAFLTVSLRPWTSVTVTCSPS